MTFQYTGKEHLLSLAQIEVNELGLRGAARREEVAPLALKGHLKRSLDIHSAKEKSQKLSAIQEKDIVDWILHREEFS